MLSIIFFEPLEIRRKYVHAPKFDQFVHSFVEHRIGGGPSDLETDNSSKKSFKYVFTRYITFTIIRIREDVQISQNKGYVNVRIMSTRLPSTCLHTIDDDVL